jgi:hypothetical protein
LRESISVFRFARAFERPSFGDGHELAFCAHSGGGPAGTAVVAVDPPQPGRTTSAATAIRPARASRVFRSS